MKREDIKTLLELAPSNARVYFSALPQKPWFQIELPGWARRVCWEFNEEPPMDEIRQAIEQAANR